MPVIVPSGPHQGKLGVSTYLARFTGDMPRTRGVNSSTPRVKRVEYSRMRTHPDANSTGESKLWPQLFSIVGRTIGHARHTHPNLAA